MKNEKQRQKTNNYKWQTMTNDKQQMLTNKTILWMHITKADHLFFLKPNVLSNMSKPSRSDFRSVDKDNIIGQKVSLYIFCPRVNGTTRYDLVRVMTNLGLALEGWSKIARLHQLLYDILPSNELTPNINLGVGGPADHLDTWTTWTTLTNWTTLTILTDQWLIKKIIAEFALFTWSCFCSFLTKTKQDQALPRHFYGEIWPRSTQFWLWIFLLVPFFGIEHVK